MCACLGLGPDKLPLTEDKRGETGGDPGEYPPTLAMSSVSQAAHAGSSLQPQPQQQTFIASSTSPMNQQSGNVPVNSPGQGLSLMSPSAQQIVASTTPYQGNDLLLQGQRIDSLPGIQQPLQPQPQQQMQPQSAESYPPVPGQGFDPNGYPPQNFNPSLQQQPGYPPQLNPALDKNFNMAAQQEPSFLQPPGPALFQQAQPQQFYQPAGPAFKRESVGEQMGSYETKGTTPKKSKFKRSDISGEDAKMRAWAAMGRYGK